MIDSLPAECALSDQSGYEVCAACAASVSVGTDSFGGSSSYFVFYVILILHCNVLLCQGLDIPQLLILVDFISFSVGLYFKLGDRVEDDTAPLGAMP